MTSPKKSSWFTRLLGLEPSRKENARPGERAQALEIAADKVGATFSRFLVGMSSEIKKKVNDLAKKKGIDARYVAGILFGPSKNWPSMPAEDKKMLHALKSILIDAGQLSAKGGQLPPFELEGQVDDTILELTEWAKVKLFKDVREAYYRKAVEEAAKPLIDVLVRPNATDPLVDVASQVSGYFKHRLSTGGETSPQRLLMLGVLDGFDML